MADKKDGKILSRKYKFIFLGVLVHILYLKSMFDVYFTSPLVRELSPIPPYMDSPAKRLVLFVADGLRADRFYEVDAGAYPESRAPYLRFLIKTRGAWGVSHTRVPTETRPGHVAIIAGFYEDVAAVTKGWKENPVDFDSVFNESQKTFAWGSPEVLPIFTFGGNTDHIIVDSYDQTMVDFAGRDGSALDSWVYDKVEKFFIKAQNNATLNELLRKDKIVFFLHLLGLDTNGHSHRPHSKEYLDNIKSMDSGVKKMENLFENFFGQDNRTAYIMTSDHGMSDWGSHGSGHPDETLTPIVAWGAGIRGPEYLEHQIQNANENDISKRWNLNNMKKSDVSQADIAPLMATLTGIPIPVNSVGTVPVDYLNTSQQFKAESLFRNARQILAQYDRKQETTRQSAIIFTPFWLTDLVREKYLREIRKKINSHEYREAMKLSRDLIESSLTGLRYYHSHNTHYIATIVTFGFIGWICSLVIEITKHHTDLDLQSSRLRGKSSLRFMPSEKFIRAVFAFIAVSVVICMVQKSANATEYLYCLMPLLVWYQIVSDRVAVVHLLHFIWKEISLLQSVGFIIVYGLFIVLLVCSFTNRSILSIILLSLGMYPFVSRKTVSMPFICWFFICIVVSAFPLLPTIVREGNYALVAIAGLLTAASCLTYAFVMATNNNDSLVSFGLAGSVTLCTLLRLHTVKNIHSKLGLPLFNQIICWILAFTVPVFALLTNKRSTSRLHAVFISVICIYILTCVSHEGLFLFFLALAMVAWISCEENLRLNDAYWRSRRQLIGEDAKFTELRPLTFGDVRIAFAFIYFILLGFFGTGNIASINSFDPAAVNCFITVFNPTLMAMLISVKILMPLVLVACALSAMQNVLHINVRGLFYIVLVITDLMSIVFFFLVKDEGSWQDIGTSISHFVIMLSFIIFLVPLFELACLLTGSVTTRGNKSHNN